LLEPTIAEMMAIMFSWSCQMAVASSRCQDSDDDDDDDDDEEDLH